MVSMSLETGPRWKTQTQVHDPANGKEGNCTQAVVASILGLDLDEVPDFNLLHKDDPHAGPYWQHLEEWFAERGWCFLIGPGDRSYETYYLAAGPSPRGVSHFVVMRDGAVVHDPHPSRAGIERISHTWVLMPLDPALFTKKDT
jgi:hypothetical protein